MDKIETVKVANGFVEGQVRNILGRDIVQFLCIPYCNAPVKELRFQKPQPYESFSDKVINKLEFETCPPQPFNELFDENLGNEKIWIVKERSDEDSLYVNVWCPLEVLTGKEKQPVFIFIYGGGYVSGSSSLDVHNGSILSSLENIIVVSFNYRIGMLGFLCLDDHIKGNLAIWDQVCALKWIYHNISAFNGDRENMTLDGYSAGGSSASLHLIIEESWPYFTKIIMQSGVCLSASEVFPKEEVNRRSIICVNKILRKLQFPYEWETNLSCENKKSIIKFLQKIDFENFLIDFDLISGFFQFSWAPCVDGELIKDQPKVLFTDGKFKKCATICQNVANEGHRFIASSFSNIIVDDSKMVPIKYLHEVMEYYPNFPSVCEDSVIEKIKSEYKIEGESVSIDTLDKIISDQYFVVASIEMVDFASKFHEDVYFLWFNTPLEHGLWPKWCGVLHGDDVYHLFGNTLKPDSGSSHSEKETSQMFMKQYGNFIRNGRLLNSLPSYNERSKSYISIDKDGWVVKVFLEDQLNKLTFWNSL